MQERDQAIQEIILKGLAINAVHGTARAWVYLLHHEIPRATVLTVLGKAASRTSSRPHAAAAAMPPQDAYAGDFDV